MRREVLFSALSLALLMGGCRSYRKADVVSESYIHKYGVEVSKDDWALNGKNGQVVSLRSDGVRVSRSYLNGVLEGKTTYSFPNSSTIARIETYSKGDLVSKTDNYLTGVPKEEQKFAGPVVAEVDRWYEDGTPAMVEMYNNGRLARGEYKTPLNVVEARVEEGMGVRLAFANSGLVLSKDTIREGQMVERITYFETGEPAVITPYANGEIHGVRKTFFPGGLPNTVEEWVHGQQEGTTVIHVNGEKVAEVPYVKGSKHGIERRYRDGKALAEEVSWKMGVQHGPRKLIVSDTETKIEWYQQGELVSRPTYERMNLR